LGAALGGGFSSSSSSSSSSPWRLPESQRAAACGGVRRRVAGTAGRQEGRGGREARGGRSAARSRSRSWVRSRFSCGGAPSLLSLFVLLRLALRRLTHPPTSGLVLRRRVAALGECGRVVVAAVVAAPLLALLALFGAALFAKARLLHLVRVRVGVRIRVRVRVRVRSGVRVRVRVRGRVRVRVRGRVRGPTPRPPPPHRLVQPSCPSCPPWRRPCPPCPPRPPSAWPSSPSLG
jgi:hypothetical protein